MGNPDIHHNKVIHKNTRQTPKVESFEEPNLNVGGYINSMFRSNWDKKYIPSYSWELHKEGEQ